MRLPCVSDELARQLRPFEKQLPRLTSQIGFRSINEVLELFAKLPTPNEILALRPNDYSESTNKTTLIFLL